MKTRLISLLSAVSVLCAGTVSTGIIAAAENVSEAEDAKTSMVVSEDTRARRGTVKRDEAEMFASGSADTESDLFSSTIDGKSGTVQDVDGKEVTKDLLEYFRTETERFSEEIDVSAFDIDYTDEEDFKTLYQMLIYSSPRSYYLLNDDGTYQYFYPYVENGKIKYIYPIYSQYVGTDVYDADLWLVPDAMDKEFHDEVDGNQAVFDTEIAKIQDTTGDGDTDFERVMKYHDYLVMNYNYDWDSWEGTSLDKANNTALSLIKNGEGLCQAFSVLYNYLLIEDDLETGFVTSYETETNSAYHTWNMVRLNALSDGGKTWYNVDVTWDENEVETISKDAKNARKTALTNFLISDKATYRTHAGEFKTPDESGTVNVDYTMINGLAENEKLDDAPWRKGTGACVAEHDGVLYYMTNENADTILHSYDAGSLSTNKLYEFPDNWSASLDGKISYAGLACIGDSLYFNGPKTVYEYYIPTGGVTVTDDLLIGEMYSCASDENGLQLYTGYYNNGTLEKLTHNATISTDLTLVDDIRCEGGKVKAVIGTMRLNKSAMLAVKTGDGTLKTVVFNPRATENYTVEIDGLKSGSATVFLWDLNTMQPLVAGSGNREFEIE